MPAKRITIILRIHGKLTRDRKMSEPDIFWILEKWLERPPEVKGRERDIQQNQIGFYLHRGADRGDAIYRDPGGITIRFEPDRQRECQPGIVLDDKYLFHVKSGG